MTADVSVIVPAYRAKATIAQALDSISAQTVAPREVIVVDDGSGDGTAEAAEALRDALAPIALRVIRQDNQGAGAARNRGIMEATGARLAFLDADDSWQTEKLAASLAVMDAGSHVLIAHDFEAYDGRGAARPVRCAALFAAAPDPVLGLYKKGFIGTSTVVADTDAVRRAGGFDASLPTAQDFDLWLRLVEGGAPFTVFDGMLARYRVNDAGITAQTARRLRCTLNVAARHYPAIRHRAGAFGALLYRIAAVHREAVAAHAAKGRYGALVGTLLMAPFRGLRVLFQAQGG